MLRSKTANQKAQEAAARQAKRDQLYARVTRESEAGDRAHGITGGSIPFFSSSMPANSDSGVYVGGKKQSYGTGIFTSKRDETGKVTGSEKWLSEADKAAKNKAENKTESKADILARLEKDDADFRAKLVAIEQKTQRNEERAR